MATYTARIPTVDYGYIEVTSEEEDDFLTACVRVLGEVESIFGKKPVTYDQAVKNVQEGFKPAPAGSVGEQALADAHQQDRWGNPILGKDPVSGEEIIYSSDGKYGPKVRAGKLYGSLPKGWDKSTVPTLDQAVKALNDRREWDRKKAAEAA